MNESKSDGLPKKSVFAQDQFKSTKKWNEIIDSFYGNMPLKRHWKNFRTFNDCFTASEAIEWIYRYLKSSPNFQHLNVTRQNAIKLLQIYLKERIIEDVRSGENFSFKEFQDDDRIYRFCTSNAIFANKNQLSSSTKLSNESILETCQREQNKKPFGNLSNKETSTNTNVENRIKNSKFDDSKENEAKSQTFNTVSLENLALSVNTNAIRKRNSSPIIKHTETSKDMKPFNFKSINHDSELWSKITRKMFESIVRKAVMYSNVNITKGLYIEQENKKSERESNERLSPKLSSTLKRSNDVKITLINILCKKSHDILMNVSGSNIEHNTNNINKHGVVINTDDDLPIWVVRAMHTLLNWESDNDCEYPRFNDVFQEIVEYFNTLGSPLLTNDLSILFLEIFDLMISKSNELNKRKEIKIKNENILDLVCDQLNQESLNGNNKKEDDKDSPCLNYRILNMIVSSFNLIINEDKNNKEILLEHIEKHLLENAKLNLFNNFEHDENNLNEIPNLTKNKEREDVYLSLLMDTLAKFENCCQNCKKIYDEINEFLNFERDIVLDANDHDNHDLLIKRKKLYSKDPNNDEMNDVHYDFQSHLKNRLNYETESAKRLHRNNSFKAAIDDKVNRLNETNDDAFKKRILIRSSTNNSNDFNFTRSFFAKEEVIQDSENFDISSENQFKIPNALESIGNDCCTRKGMIKSLSNQNLIMDEFEGKKMPRKRKASPEASNVEQLVLIFSNLNQTTSKSSDLDQIRESRIKAPTKIAPSVSFSTFTNNNRLIQEQKQVQSSISLQVLTDIDRIFPKSKNIHELNSFIKKSLSKNCFIDNNDKDINKDEDKVEEELSDECLLSTEIDSEMFFFIISSFRLLALMLPPSNKRKLHFLLRFLNKLKYSKNIDDYLLKNQLFDSNQIGSGENEIGKNEDFDYIDLSMASIISKSDNFSESKQEQLPKKNTHPLTNTQTKSNQIEYFLISSFLKSIIGFDDQGPENGHENEDNNQQTKQNAYASKIVQILINNYSEIMRIPDELVNNFRQKLRTQGNQAEKNMANIRNKKDFSLSTDELNRLCESERIFKPPGSRNFMESFDDKQQSKKLKENSFQQNVKIKKALNVLGLNDSISYLSLNQKQQQESESSLILSKDNIFTSSLNENAINNNINNNNNSNKTNQFINYEQNSSSSSNFLNSSTLSAFPSKSSIFQSTSSINFPRLFSNKKWKKENLI